MTKITDKPYLEACRNENGTYSAVKAAQWLYEATTGRPLPEDEARALVESAKLKAKARQQERR